ncbi:hypothetical protein FDA33_02995 [Clostridium botulinum]|nr:hypothetical protein [Clostridium botulinum]NFI17021.1 hypothetical protein [Clostridium botulinum]NFI53040.1 hypothetical protein [Clostridium botulinum]NFL91956.1 hypothetical protein [Clostridium botulinum]NFN51314.1 hypothetical protein [Clostridium botulinum]
MFRKKRIYFDKSVVYKKTNGFTIIESIVYIFFTTIIFFISTNLIIDSYKLYIQNQEISRVCNKMQNFYINLDSILKKDIIRDIDFGETYLMIYRDKDNVLISKNIKSDKEALGAKYPDRISPNILLKEVKDFKVIQKEKLIYLKIIDKSGKVFVRCI